jgi:hypothetical protein
VPDYYIFLLSSSFLFFFFIILLLLLVISFTQLGSFLFPAFTLAGVFDQPSVQLEPENQAAG